jgi:hypothetical protein
MVTSPKGLGPEKDYAGEDQQHIFGVLPVSRYITFAPTAQKTQLYCLLAPTAQKISHVVLIVACRLTEAEMCLPLPCLATFATRTL